VSDDDKFDALVRREMKYYHATTSAPADEIWAAIEADVADAIRAPRRHRTRWTWVAVAAGMAAALVIGMALGRRSTPATIASTPVPVAADDAPLQAQLRAKTVSHLADAEMFLTAVRADLQAGRSDPERVARSRDLLTRTRLLEGTSNGQAPAVERLLQDLELVLAEISALPDTGRPIDRELLADRLRKGTILPRIRTTLPAPSAGL